MRKILFLFIFFLAKQANAQNLTGFVMDEVQKKPVPYAIVIYSNQQKIIYTDSSGFFSLPKDSISVDDTIFIKNIGYQTLIIPVKTIRDAAQYYLAIEEHTLRPVFISACKKTKSFDLNKRVGAIKQYIGPGPEYKLIILAKYDNNSGKPGYIHSFSIYLDEPDNAHSLPLRLRWYDYDVINQRPGKELTDTSLIVHPYKKGWNTFDIPDNTIFFPAQHLVLGVEFIYSQEYHKEYALLKTSTEKLNWLNNMKNRWALGMQYVRDNTDGGFYLVNNETIPKPYGLRFERFYIRPALRFSINVCVEK
ncbi:MAG: hypothetical protein JSS67_07150 [Bacteroidetes bacterium]|nr:hypothetical protein [Bacteroidota bacterium]